MASNRPGLSQEEYEILTKALFDEAVGGREIETTTVRTKLDENDKKLGSDLQNITHKTEPNIPLLQSMLANRIGGPEDYC